MVLSLSPQNAIVVSNSCDNQRATILVAPLEEIAVTGNAVARWKNIRERATGTKTTKRFYLPGSERFGLRRSQALLDEFTPLESSFLEMSGARGATLACGLSGKAIEHLQWAVAGFFGRNSRDDLAWPSKEDLGLMLEFVKSELEKPTLSLEDRADLTEQEALVEERLASPDCD
ncbi:MAG: hypothetical protein WKG00_18730 [Polyangiaceae bacterium]